MCCNISRSSIRTVAIVPHDGYVHAKSICTSIGARLCTVAELNAQETRGSGCQHDAEWLWTTQRCDGGHLTQIGSDAWGDELCPDDCPAQVPQSARPFPRK